MRQIDCAVGLAAPALRDHIERYVSLRGHGLAPGSHSAVPSRYAMVMISLAGPVQVTQMQNHRAAFSDCVGGVNDSPATVTHGGHRDAVYISLKPASIRTLFGVESSELSRRLIDLRDIWGNRVDTLRQQLNDAATSDERFRILDEAFQRNRKLHRACTPIAWAWDRMLETHGQIGVDHLASEVGWSRRHFGERFRAEIGISPKAAARILRFEHACTLIKRHRPSLAHVAAECGYFDQAHLTLEWNALAGMTPRAWIRQELPFFQDFDSWPHDNTSHEERHAATEYQPQL